MRRTLKIGIGAGTAALIATMSAGVASATTNGSQTAGSAATMTSVNKHITRAQAGRIARAAVPHSHVREIESDDLNGQQVWKVQLGTPHGRVVVDVNKRTGKVTILHGRRGHGGGGHDESVLASSVSPGSIAGLGGASRTLADDHGRDARDNDGAREVRDNDGARDVRDNDGARDARDHDARGHDRGDDRGHDRGHDRGDDGSGR
jgi:hypothetical protein